MHIAQECLIPLPQLLDMSWSQVRAISSTLVELKSISSHSSPSSPESKDKVFDEQQSEAKMRELYEKAKAKGGKVSLADLVR